uniref:Disease resistance N-terminal domain-containing protein n=1 Tax=Populus trichocarpa TaxID=3694 RepID=B9IC16_POPTR
MASRRLLDFFKAQRLNGRLMKKLRILMLIVNEVLNDAEEKQITKAYVKEWPDELRDTAYYEAARDFHLVDEYEAQGSRIAVTTRSVGIASVKPTVPTRRLRELTEGDAWLVFAKYAFDDGSLLRSRRDAKEREKIMESSIGDFSNDGIRSCVSEVILALSSWISRLSPLNINKYGFKPGKKKEIWEEIESVLNVS